MRGLFRWRPVAEHASAWGAVWWNKARSRSAPPIVISKAAWAIETHTYIWVRPQSWRPARWLDLFARHPAAAGLRNTPRALQSDVPKANRNRPRLWKSWPAFHPACAVAFSLSIKTI